jgi:hypothetical protein
MKKEKESSEDLPIETKKYFGEIFSILRVHNFFLSDAGMNLNRTRIGRVNSLSMNVIRLLVKNDRFLDSYSEENEPVDSYGYLYEKKQSMSKVIKIQKLDSTSQKKEILTKLGVMLEFAWEAANEKKDNEKFSYAHDPIGWGIEIVRSMLIPLIDKNKVKDEFEKIKHDSNKLNLYYRDLYHQVDDGLHGREQELLLKRYRRM